jgi:hypothetical protein
MIRSLFVLGIIAGMAAPAFADGYYIVRGPDKHCRVVEKIPEGREFIRVGPLSFGTRDEAERQVKVVCRDADGGVVVRERQEERR